jgi:hypothetical protein
MKYKIILTTLMAGSLFMAKAQEKAKPEDTEIWDPIPKVVTPGVHLGDAPSDAIILFDGKNLDQWVQNSDGSPAKWDVADGILTVNKNYGNIETKQPITNCTLNGANLSGSKARDRAEATVACSWHQPVRGMTATNCRFWIHTTIKLMLMAWPAAFTNRLFRWLIPVARMANGRFTI